MAWQTFPVNFQGGLVRNMNSLQQGFEFPGSAVELQNLEPSLEGGYKEVLGYQKFIDTVVPGQDQILGVAFVSTSKTVAARSNGTVTQFHLWKAGWSSLGTAANLGDKVRFARFNFDGNDKIYFVDGVNYPCVYNDTSETLTYLTGPLDIQGARHVEIFKNTIFVSKGSNLVFSVPYDETDYTTGNGGGIINVGFDIVGLIVFRDQLIIFGRNEIIRLVGSSSSDFRILPIANLGCSNEDTIQEVGGDIMYMSADGVRLLSATERIGDFGLEVASAQIDPEFKTFLQNNETYNSVVIRGKAQYRIFSYSPLLTSKFSKGLLATKFSDQGAQRIEWATLAGFKVYSADSVYYENNEYIIFANEDGYIYEMEEGSSLDGGDIESIYQSPQIFIDDPKVRKTIYKASLHIDLIGVFEVDFNLKFDLYKSNTYNPIQPKTIVLSSSDAGVFTYGSPQSVYGTATYASQLDKVYDAVLVGSGNSFSFRIASKSTNPSFKLDSIIFEYKSLGRN